MLYVRGGLPFGSMFILLIGVLCQVALPVNSQFTATSCFNFQQPGIDAQTSTSPYSIFSEVQEYTPGVPMRVFVISSQTFTSILVVARSGGIVVGTFALPDVGFEYLPCPGSQTGVITSVTVDNKVAPIFFTYTPPIDLNGDLEITIAVENSPGTYWVLTETLPNSNRCLPNPCENGGTCTPSPDPLTVFTCECTTIYTGTTCTTRIINVENLRDGIFDLQDYFISRGNEFEFLFTTVPTNSLVDIYLGEGLSFSMGLGNVLLVNEIVAGPLPLQIFGGEFWLRVTVVDDTVSRPFQFQLGIYQFIIPFPVDIPGSLRTFTGTFYVIQEVPPGSIVLISGVAADRLRFGTGRRVGVNEITDEQIMTVRLGKYDTYVWYCLVGPVPSFLPQVTTCTTDPCDVEPCNAGYCVADTTGCNDFICGSLTATECASCCPNPCWNRGVCQYQPTFLFSHSCDCPSQFVGSTCSDGTIILQSGESFDLIAEPLFIPVWKNFYIHFTVPANSRVIVSEVQGFDAQFGLGPITKEMPVVVTINQPFVVTGSNEFWACLAPNGGLQSFSFQLF